MTTVIGPLRVFVGCAANNEDLESQAVFEYTLRKHASIPVEITWMQLSANPHSKFFSYRGSGWRTVQWATPFSGFRWGVPTFAGFSGRAVYFDSDFIIQGDIAELATVPFEPGKIVIAGQRFCCSVWNAAAARDVVPTNAWWFQDLYREDGHARATRFYTQHKEFIQPFSRGNWNTLDIALPADFSEAPAIHYTQMHCQPQLKHAIPRLERTGLKHWYTGKVKPHPRQDLQSLFDRLLVEATNSGYPLGRYVRVPYGAYQIRGAK